MTEIREVAYHRCKRCKSYEPTIFATFMQTRGKVFRLEVAKIQGRYCSACAGHWFRTLTGSTLLRGWWSPTSILLTPIFLVRNVWNYARVVRWRMAGTPR